MRQGVFVTSTGTSSGKTYVSRGLAAALREAGRRVMAVKPMETGCEPDPLDALALARAAGDLKVARDGALYRAATPVCPYAATLLGSPAANLEHLVARVRELGRDASHLVVEGAGGVLVPIDETHDMSDFARALELPILLVAPNRLGVLSHVLTATEAATRRSLEITAVVLSEPDPNPDASSSTNRRILEQRLLVPVLEFPHCADDDSILAHAARRAKLLEALGWG